MEDPPFHLNQDETTLNCGGWWPTVSVQDAYFPDIGTDQH